MPGTVDPFYGIGRTSYETCKWWKRQTAINNRNGEDKLEVVCHNILPEGEFKVEETSPISTTQNNVGDIQIQRRTVTLSTVAEIPDLKQGDLVEYQGRIWKIQSIAKTEFWARSYYAKKNESGAKSIVLVS